MLKGGGCVGSFELALALASTNLDAVVFFQVPYQSQVVPGREGPGEVIPPVWNPYSVVLR